MKIFDKLFKKNKFSYKISQAQENCLVIMLTPNKEIKLNSKIIVPENFNAIVFTKEKLLDIIPSGEYELNALTILKTCKANKLDKPTKKGYKTKFSADFYFVNLNICKISNKFKIKKLKNSIDFELQFKIINSKKFLKFLIDEKVVFDDKFASHYLNFSVSKLIYYYFLDNSIVTKEKILNYITSKLTLIGVEVLDFDMDEKNFTVKNQTQVEAMQNANLNFNDRDKQINNVITQDKKQVNKENEKNYEEEKLNRNENQIDKDFVFKPFHSLVNLEDIVAENITYFICDNCGAKLSKDSKVCYNCKKSFIEKNCCEYCGKEIKKGTFVCPHCNSVLIGN